MPSSTDVDWDYLIRRWHALGVWHAVQYLKGITGVKDPIESARDAMQEAWITLMRRGIRKGDKVKGLVIVHALSAARNIVRGNDFRPISSRADGIGSQGRPIKDAWKAKTWPVQIFGMMLNEVTFDEDLHCPNCGDE